MRVYVLMHDSPEGWTNAPIVNIYESLAGAEKVRIRFQSKDPYWYQYLAIRDFVVRKDRRVA